jgi:cephalosporin-C deacetylase-like acetyl esterase
MVEPEDYGLGPLAMLSRIGACSRSPRHGTFWKTWSPAVFAHTPALRPRIEQDPSDSSATHEFTSAREVRIGSALLLPNGRPAAGLVALHGYEQVPSLDDTAARWKPLTEHGVAVLCVRLRGYPGSQTDVPWLVQHAGNAGGGQWITHGLDIPISESGYGCEWSYTYAVADVVNACRALKAFIRPRAPAAPIFLHGESFGGGLAITAAAQLLEHHPDAAPVRLAIGLPSMGDWPWRLSQPRNLTRGMDAIIQRFLAGHAHLAADITATLRTFDTVLHARRIRCPVLCKLALRDDVVPAPTAAAVFNALGTDPGLKHRFVTRFGHFDGGIADMRRHATFERLVHQFLDPAVDPLRFTPPSAAPAHAPPGALSLQPAKLPQSS